MQASGAIKKSRTLGEGLWSDVHCNPCLSCWNFPVHRLWLRLTEVHYSGLTAMTIICRASARDPNC